MWEYNHTVRSDELYHFGIPGMKWGHRKNYSTIANGSASYAVRRALYSAPGKELLNDITDREGSKNSKWRIHLVPD